MTITLQLSADKATFLLKRQNSLFTAKFVAINKGILQVELEFEDSALNFVAQELIYVGEDYVLYLVNKNLNENNLPR
jgi:hypothetical protein